MLYALWKLPDLGPDACCSQRRHTDGIVGDVEGLNALEDLGTRTRNVAHVELLIATSCNDDLGSNLFIVCTSPE
jgi:hypothetical protein